MKNPIAIAISSGVSCFRNAASLEILSSRPGAAATAVDVCTSASSFTTQKSTRAASPRERVHEGLEADGGTDEEADERASSSAAQDGTDAIPVRYQPIAHVAQQSAENCADDRIRHESRYRHA